MTSVVEIDENNNIYNIYEYKYDILGYDCLILDEKITNVIPKPSGIITKLVKTSLDVLQKNKLNINDNI